MPRSSYARPKNVLPEALSSGVLYLDPRSHLARTSAKLRPLGLEGGGCRPRRYAWEGIAMMDGNT